MQTTELAAAPASFAEIAKLTAPDEATLSKAASAAVRMVQTFTIESQDDYDMAATELADVKGRIKRLEDQRMAITRPLDAAKTAVMDLFRRPTESLKAVEATWKNKMLSYSNEQERKAKAAQEEANRLAEIERKRLEAEAAAQRQRAEQEAARLAAEGKPEAANDVMQQAAAAAEQTAAVAQVMAAPVVVPEFKQARGTSTSDKLNYEVTDHVALLKDIVAQLDQRPELANLISVDSIRMRAHIKVGGLQTRLAGLRVFTEKVMSSRAAA